MKQRLIDASKIRYSDMSDGQVPGGLWYTFKDNVDEMPTVEAIPIEQLLSILPKYDDYIHTKTYRNNETMEDIYSKGHEEGWNACLKAIKEELDYWKKENEHKEK